MDETEAPDGSHTPRGCYDCGSTIPGHHTTNCELAAPGSQMDLMAVPGTQYWVGCFDADGRRILPEDRRKSL